MSERPTGAAPAECVLCWYALLQTEVEVLGRGTAKWSR